MAVAVLSVVILLLLQAVPWGSLTGNRLKDFNLFADIFPHETSYEPIAAATDIDPELQSYMDEFCFRFNRRNTANQLFFRLTRAVATSCALLC